MLADPYVTQRQNENVLYDRIQHIISTLESLRHRLIRANFPFVKNQGEKLAQQIKAVWNSPKSLDSWMQTNLDTSSLQSESIGWFITHVRKISPLLHDLSTQLQAKNAAVIQTIQDRITYYFTLWDTLPVIQPKMITAWVSALNGLFIPCDRTAVGQILHTLVSQLQTWQQYSCPELGAIFTDLTHILKFITRTLVRFPPTPILQWQRKIFYLKSLLRNQPPSPPEFSALKKYAIPDTPALLNYLTARSFADENAFGAFEEDLWHWVTSPQNSPLFPALKNFLDWVMLPKSLTRRMVALKHTKQFLEAYRSVIFVVPTQMNIPFFPKMILPQQGRIWFQRYYGIHSPQFKARTKPKNPAAPTVARASLTPSETFSSFIKDPAKLHQACGQILQFHVEKGQLRQNSAKLVGKVSLNGDPSRREPFSAILARVKDHSEESRLLVGREAKSGMQEQYQKAARIFRIIQELLQSRFTDWTEFHAAYIQIDGPENIETFFSLNRHQFGGITLEEIPSNEKNVTTEDLQTLFIRPSPRSRLTNWAIYTKKIAEDGEELWTGPLPEFECRGLSFMMERNDTIFGIHDPVHDDIFICVTIKDYQERDIYLLTTYLGKNIRQTTPQLSPRRNVHQLLYQYTQLAKGFWEYDDNAKNGSVQPYKDLYIIQLQNILKEMVRQSNLLFDSTVTINQIPLNSIKFSDSKTVRLEQYNFLLDALGKPRATDEKRAEVMLQSEWAKSSLKFTDILTAATVLSKYEVLRLFFGGISKEEHPCNPYTLDLLPDGTVRIRIPISFPCITPDFTFPFPVRFGIDQGQKTPIERMQVTLTRDMAAGFKITATTGVILEDEVTKDAVALRIHQSPTIVNPSANERIAQAKTLIDRNIFQRKHTRNYNSRIATRLGNEWERAFVHRQTHELHRAHRNDHAARLCATAITKDLHHEYTHRNPTDIAKDHIFFRWHPDQVRFEDLRRTGVRKGRDRDAEWITRKTFDYTKEGGQLEGYRVDTLDAAFTTQICAHCGKLGEKGVLVMVHPAETLHQLECSIICGPPYDLTAANPNLNKIILHLDQLATDPQALQSMAGSPSDQYALYCDRAKALIEYLFRREADAATPLPPKCTAKWFAQNGTAMDGSNQVPWYLPAIGTTQGRAVMLFGTLVGSKFPGGLFFFSTGAGNLLFTFGKDIKDGHLVDRDRGAAYNLALHNPLAWDARRFAVNLNELVAHRTSTRRARYTARFKHRLQNPGIPEWTAWNQQVLSDGERTLYEEIMEYLGGQVNQSQFIPRLVTELDQWQKKVISFATSFATIKPFPRPIRIMLDNSVIERFFDNRSPEMHAVTRKFFFLINKIKEIQWVMCKTNSVELNLLKVISRLTLIHANNVIWIDEDESPVVQDLADFYVNQGIINKKELMDARMVATAIYNSIDYLIVWDLGHILSYKVNDSDTHKDTIGLINMENQKAGLKGLSPMSKEVKEKLVLDDRVIVLTPKEFMALYWE
jgi:hypothetical protein